MSTQKDMQQQKISFLEEENSRLREQVRRADAASRAKSDFLAMVSHEIRTPMNGVIGITELLLGTELDQKQRHYAGLISRSASSLLSLINSLLDFSKIEADKLQIENKPLDLQLLINELATLFSVSAKTRDIEITTKVSSDIAGLHMGDQQRIRQVIVNLLGNAIKFSEGGTITICLELEKQLSEVDYLRFTVRDQGPGIDEKHLEEIFQPFTQADGGATRQHGGTGLGLSISRRLIELMGGKIGVDSTPGHGSSFWFTLQLQKVPVQLVEEHQSTPKQEEESSHLAGLINILIVDDEEINRMVLSETLASSDVQTATASNGQEALDICREENFDLIFMDCQMPVMDGFSATNQILTLKKEQGGKIPVIVALTADITQKTKKRCKQVGMSDYMIKPLEASELQRVFNRWLPGLQFQARTDTEEPSLVAENDEKGQINQVRLDRLQKNVGNVGPIVQVFVRTLPERIKNIEQAVAESDCKALQLAAHQLKGSSRQLGADYLAARCQELENLAKSEKIHQLDVLMEQIKRSGTQVVAILNKKLA